jgi:pimeloyl-ACP methyl ester carboxylesterase
VLDRILDRFIFQPTAGAELDPARLGIRAETLWLRAEDGVRLHGFWLPAEGETRAILMLHGNAGNASHRLPRADALRRLGAHVLLLDYRGYGLSDGSPGEPGCYADARAALALLAESGIPASRVVVFGHSLGGAIAVDLAADRALAGLVLESTFSSLADVARRFAGPLGSWLLHGRFDSRAKIGRLRAPLLQLHGDRDDLVRIEAGRALFAAAPAPKRFETLVGAGHNDTAEHGGRGYLATIQKFLDEAAPR